jgi:hypothetical protein
LEAEYTALVAVKTLAPEEEGLQRAEDEWVGMTLFDMQLGDKTKVCENGRLVCELLARFDKSVKVTSGLPPLSTAASANLEAAVVAAGAAGEYEVADGTALKFSQARFSVLRGGGSIQPHCGETNNRLRLHLALRAPTATVDGGVAAILVNGTRYVYEAVRRSRGLRQIPASGSWKVGLLLRK